MKTHSHFTALCVAGLSWCGLMASNCEGFQLQPVEVQSRETGIVDSARAVLTEIMAIPAKSIPQSLLADAQGIAIMPGLLKGGFVVGIRHGRGVIVVKDDNGAWRPPAFVTISGGSFGWQAGVQAADIILVFKSRTSVESLLRGKFTIGAGVAAAAGPVGRQAEAGTDARLKAEIFSYSRSRGLFAGLALDGSVIKLDPQADAAYYRTAPAGQAGQPASLPPSAVRLLQEIAKYTTGQGDAAAVAQLPASSAPTVSQETQRELAASSRRLAAILDDNWQKFLALPAEVYGADSARCRRTSCASP